MCDSNGTKFFRPWNSVHPNDETSDERTSGSDCVNVKQEEDSDSILSETTCEESSSAASFSENEVIPRRYRSRRRSSESFSADASTRSCSANSEEANEGSTLDMLSNFVLNSHATTTTAGYSAISPNSREATSACSSMDHREFGADYVRRISCDGTFDGSACFASVNVPPTPPPSTVLPPFYYGFPSVHQFPQGLCATSMHQAVELIHRQDAAAKQMKKLRPKKFRCEHCDVAFSNNGQLKGHIRIHTGERPFKCDTEGCGKSFTRNEELTRHKRIHTGLRPHSCVLCGKRFGRKDHLKKHMRTHESRDPYRVSPASLGVFALGHPLNHPLPPYVYPI